MANDAKYTTGEYQAALTGAGIPPGFEQYISQAVQNGWSAEELANAIYGSPEFGTMFPGIFRPDGSMRLTAAEYLQVKDAYLHSADQYGFSLTSEDIATMISQNKSPDEVTTQFAAIQRIEESPAVFKQFQKQLEAAGFKDISKAQLVDFALGMAPKDWYDVWEKTSIAAGAKMAGIGLGQKGIEQIQRATGGRLTEEQVATSMEKLAKDIRTSMPLSQIYKFGLTRSDLIAAEFGGPGAAVAREKLQRVENLAQDFMTKQRARTTIQPTQGGGQSTYGGQQDRAQVQ